MLSVILHCFQLNTKSTTPVTLHNIDNVVKSRQRRIPLLNKTNIVRLYDAIYIKFNLLSEESKQPVYKHSSLKIQHFMSKLS